MHTITLIAGDGIGPEVTAAVVTIVERAGLQVEWEPHLAGVSALERHGATIPPELLESIKRNKVALKGPVTTPVGGGFTSVNVGLRKALSLFVNLGPCGASLRCPRAIQASISSSFGRIPRTSTRGSSTKWCPASSRA